MGVHCSDNTKSQSLHRGITVRGVGRSTRTACPGQRTPDKSYLYLWPRSSGDRYFLLLGLSHARRHTNCFADLVPSECSLFVVEEPKEQISMATACPIDLDTYKLREEIRSIYARVAADPSSEFHFHRGPEYAAAFLGYDPAALAELPSESTASFAGIANPHR